MAIHTIKEASEWGIGGSVNGTGRRQRIFGFYVVDTRTNKAVHAFQGKIQNDPVAREKATAWATKLDEMVVAGHLR
jgi:hypothetical protein